ncbi:thyroxine 5'-deiodinase [Tieghemostelium lacteum]|uniref:Thyroxine 5'-deiodinase n=1 Tax=Tieghemostelium lacteum TaxID=361077 RepID=A0A151Z398_TIELA|nr:thyroxine 5'-deiodinase [Tieghemostelium lacteum]|eukprot:KYQ88436.1 thyroxine 5'-deiodinase [Tieghemostelium lacteum]
MLMLQEIYEEFKDRAQFYIVYLKEIHPSDGWYIGGDEISLTHKNTTTMEQRQAYVSDMKEYSPFLTIPFLIDLMDDNFNFGYDAVPERLFVLENNKFQYVGGYGPFDFLPEQLKAFLTKKFSTENPSI